MTLATTQETEPMTETEPLTKLEQLHRALDWLVEHDALDDLCTLSLRGETPQVSLYPFTTLKRLFHGQTATRIESEYSIEYTIERDGIRFKSWVSRDPRRPYQEREEVL